METWTDSEYKYEVELVEQTSIVKDGKVVEWILHYKVLSQMERSHK